MSILPNEKNTILGGYDDPREYTPNIGGYNLYKHFIYNPNCCMLHLEILLQKVRKQIHNKSQD